MKKHLFESIEKERSTVKRAIILILMAMFLLTGCETFSGFGRDMKKAGNWVEKKAEQSK